MDCLDNLVGIDKRCAPVASRSGLYLNGDSGLASFTLKLAAAATDSETAGPIQFAEKMLKLAQDDIEQRFRTFLLPFMRAKSVLENERAGKFPTDRRTKAVTQEGGWKVKVCSNGFLRFDLHSLILFYDTSGDVEVNVYNLLTGETLDTFTIPVIADTPTEYIVDKTYRGNDINLGILTQGIGDPYYIDSNCSWCGHTANYVYMSPSQMTIGADPEDSTVTSFAHPYGLMLNYSVSCDIDPFICRMSSLIAKPLRAAAGMFTHQTLLNSMERHNTYVTVDAKKNEAWVGIYANEYENSINSVLDNMGIPDNCCFKCNAVIRRKLAIP